MEDNNFVIAIEKSLKFPDQLQELNIYSDSCKNLGSIDEQVLDFQENTIFLLKIYNNEYCENFNLLRSHISSLSNAAQVLKECHKITASFSEINENFELIKTCIEQFQNFMEITSYFEQSIDTANEAVDSVIDHLTYLHQNDLTEYNKLTGFLGFHEL